MSATPAGDDAGAPGPAGSGTGPAIRVLRGDPDPAEVAAVVAVLAAASGDPEEPPARPPSMCG